VYQMYTVKTDEGPIKRDKVLKYLHDKGIMCKIYFHPVHSTKLYKKLGYNCRLPVTETVSNRVLTLPMYPTLTKTEMDYIVQEVKNSQGD
ncbi:MAG: DegT/DnrJ/EryC1/StrS aminotransferase family protein, partial [Candidatus Aenigmatarchaeota archaeon]